MNNQLPSHIEAEQSVLGTIFLDSRKIVDVMDKLSVDDFFDSKHQAIYQAMVLAYNDDMHIDYTTIISKLNQTKTLGKAGGVDYSYQITYQQFITLILILNLF